MCGVRVRIRRFEASAHVRGLSRRAICSRVSKSWALTTLASEMSRTCVRSHRSLAPCEERPANRGVGEEWGCVRWEGGGGGGGK